METHAAPEAQGGVTDAAMRKVYDDAVKQMAGEQEVRARHILVETEDEAKAIVDRAQEGRRLRRAGQAEVEGPGVAAEGGDLGYFAKDQMVPEFAEAAFKLDKGQVSDPVKTSSAGTSSRSRTSATKPVPEFEQVKDQIETFVARKAQADMIAKLREGAKIERLERSRPMPKKYERGGDRASGASRTR